MKFCKPKMEVVRFGQDDVITTSGGFIHSPLVVSNFGNRSITDNTVSYKAQNGLKSWSRDSTGGGAQDFLAFVKEYVGNDFSDDITLMTKFVGSDFNPFMMVTIIQQDGEGWGTRNGSYEYDSENKQFIKTN